MVNELLYKIQAAKLLNNAIIAKVFSWFFHFGMSS